MLEKVPCSVISKQKEMKFLLKDRMLLSLLVLCGQIHSQESDL